MSLTSYLPPPSIPSVSIQPYIQEFARVTYRTAPTGNTAVYFPGLSGSVLNFGTFFPSVADPSTSNIYVEMWIYPTNSNGSLPFTVSDSGSEDMGLLFNFGTQLEFRVWNTTGTQINSTNPGTVTINQWYHIAGSFDFTNNKVYSFVNGVVGSSVGTFTGTARSRATSSLILGAGNAGTFLPFGGYTQDFRFIKDGIVPTTSFTPSSAPFGASLPPYVTGNGTNVMSITSQYLSQQGSIISTTPGNSGSIIYSSLLGQLSSIARSNVVSAYSLRSVNKDVALLPLINIKRTTDNVTQDFYGDQFGNLLTAPVTGQTLTSWLGGASGNIVTWYDQSGNGNHMAQTVAALQPVINLATSPPSILFTGNGTTSGQYFQNTVPFTFNFGTNYQYSIRAIVNNTVGGILVYKGKLGAPWSGGGEKAWYLGPNSTVSTSGNYPDLVGFAEGWVTTTTPITSSKTSVTWVSSSFSSVKVYENLTSVAPTYTRASQLSDGDNYLYFGIKTASGVPYYNGNVYEIEIFSTPISASDVTILGT
jgi:hypothetical protein